MREAIQTGRTVNTMPNWEGVALHLHDLPLQRVYLRYNVSEKTLRKLLFRSLDTVSHITLVYLNHKMNHHI